MTAPSNLHLGKSVRLSRLFNAHSGKTVIAPLDDDLLSGPEGGLRNLEAKINQVVTGQADAIIGFPGLFLRHGESARTISGILNITASTIRHAHTRKVLVGSVEQAVQLGMDAVAVHINISSKYETEMLAILGQISRDCAQYGMPLLAHMYPRSEGDKGDNNYPDLYQSNPDAYTKLVRHVTRIGVELGADIIKTPYTGSAETFRTVVDSAMGVPVVMAGGPEVASADILKRAHHCMQAGAAGVAVGRNIFNRSQGTEMVKALRAIVHEGKTPEQALKTVEGLSVTADLAAEPEDIHASWEESAKAMRKKGDDAPL